MKSVVAKITDVQTGPDNRFTIITRIRITIEVGYPIGSDVKLVHGEVSPEIDAVHALVVPSNEHWTAIRGHISDEVISAILAAQKFHEAKGGEK